MSDTQCPLCVIGQIGAIAAFNYSKAAREKYNIWSWSSLPWKKQLPCFRSTLI